MSANLAGLGFNMKPETFSKIASEVVNLGDATVLDSLLSRLSALHCDDLRYEITTSAFDTKRAIFVSRISSAMPNLTRLVINAPVTNRDLNICLGNAHSIRQLTVRGSTDFTVSDSALRPRLARIEISHV